MKFERNLNEIIINDAPGCLWMIISFMFLIGGALIYGSLYLLTSFDWINYITILAAFLLIGAAIWTLFHAPITKTIINRLKQTVAVTRYGIFGKRENVYSFEQIDRFTLFQGKDSERNLTWTFGMKLTSGEEIRLTSIGAYSENYESKYVVAVNEFMGKSFPVAEIVFDFEDESDNEIG